jgi:cell division protein YceG involved in septum cleavage
MFSGFGGKSGLYETYTETYQTKLEDELMIGGDPFKKLRKKLEKIQEVSTFFDNEFKGKSKKRENHPLDEENIEGMSVPQGFKIIKDELIKKDKEIEELKGKIDLLFSIIEANKEKTYI